jgi:hypothetical protein
MAAFSSLGRKQAQSELAAFRTLWGISQVEAVAHALTAEEHPGAFWRRIHAPRNER